MLNNSGLTWFRLWPNKLWKSVKKRSITKWSPRARHLTWPAANCTTNCQPAVCRTTYIKSYTGKGCFDVLEKDAPGLFCQPGYNDVSYKCYRIAEHVATESYKNPGIFPQWWVIAETAFPGVKQYSQEVDDADQGLEGCTEPFFDPVRW